jgi:cellobiose epimerase
MSRRLLSPLRMIVVLALGCAIFLKTASQEAASVRAVIPKVAYVAPNRGNYLKLADETEAMLHWDVLDVWFPRSIDQENGGFHSAFARDWQPGRSEGKFSVFQGRMTWVAAEVAMRRPDLKRQYLPIAEHGVEFLSNVLWDKQNGGFFWGS